MEVYANILETMGNTPLVRLDRFWTSEPPIRVGSTYDQEAALFGRPIVSSFECVEYQPGSTMVRSFRSSPVVGPLK